MDNPIDQAIAILISSAIECDVDGDEPSCETLLSAAFYLEETN